MNILKKHLNKKNCIRLIIIILFLVLFAVALAVANSGWNGYTITESQVLR